MWATQWEGAAGLRLVIPLAQQVLSGLVLVLVFGHQRAERAGLGAWAAMDGWGAGAGLDGWGAGAELDGKAGQAGRAGPVGRAGGRVNPGRPSGLQRAETRTAAAAAPVAVGMSWL